MGRWVGGVGRGYGWRGETRKEVRDLMTGSARRPWQAVVLALGLVAVVLGGAGWRQAPDAVVAGAVVGTAQQPTGGEGGGAGGVRVVYEDAAIRPENRPVVA